jgi:SAM-dependent methyltransferase
MEYGPVKQRLSEIFNSTPLHRVLLNLLDLLFLRQWYVKRYLFDWISKNEQRSTHILDAGCGFGQTGFFLCGKSKLWNILALDKNPNLVSDCNKFFIESKLSNIVAKCIPLEELKFKDNFDLVLCIDTLEEIEEDQEVLVKFHEALKIDGKLLLLVPSNKSGFIIKPRSRKLLDSYYVRDGYSKQEIEQKLKNAGFERIKIRYAYGLAGQIAFKLGLKWPIRLLNFGILFYLILPFYFIIFLPVVVLLNFVDVVTPHFSGVGLIVKAEK